ncbi:two component system sensor histidine kinase [Desulfosarcina variabilis str. Montpellier]|uniref:sensor histidine kinase n=1 Tax=Desulfosarcina variabilis TaxID=2300 RepID=UPI003AFAD0C0
MTPVIENSQIEDLEILDFSFEAPYFQALYNAPVPVTIACEDGRLLLVNRAFQEATGYTLEMIPTLDDWADLQETSSNDMNKRFADYFALEKTLTPVQVTVKTRNGNSLVWEIFNAPLGKTVDGRRMIISIASDITGKIVYQQHLEAEVCKRTEALNRTIHALQNEVEERKRISEALTLSRERLKKLSLRTLTILEADRRSISKELHDSLGASLAAIKFSLEDKEIKRSQKGGQLDDSLEQEIAYLLSTIKETKRISANLRPTTLDDLGLMATINWYLRQLKRVYQDITVDYTTAITEEDVPEEMKIIIYRIIQEGLTNAQKHSEASVVRLHMAFTDNKGSISLFIEDNGRGFNVEETLSLKDPLSGYGLIAMRERCEIFGGSFHIESEIGTGTKIRATLPILVESPHDG